MFIKNAIKGDRYMEKSREIKLLSPKLDYVFKRIFGQVGNEEITCNLINSILENKVTKVELDKNTILEKDILDDKIGILDIKAKADNNVNINIEMQIVDKKNIEKRILYYWSKMYIQSIKQGEDYEKLEKSVIILFTDYEIENLKNIKKYITQWNIREKEERQVLLTNVFEIYIIELNKYKGENQNNKLDTWVKFIKKPEVIGMEENDKAVRKAKEILEEISSDERERYLAELRQKYIMDQKAIQDAGYDKGAKNKQIEIAKKMKTKGIDEKIILEVTELSKEEIEKI